MEHPERPEPAAGSREFDLLEPEERARRIAAMSPEERRERAAYLGYRQPDDPEFDWAHSLLVETLAERKARDHRVWRGFAKHFELARRWRHHQLGRAPAPPPRIPNRARAPRSRRQVATRSAAAARSPGSPSEDDDLADALARLEAVVEAHEVGDTDYAAAIALDLLSDLQAAVERTKRNTSGHRKVSCRFCTLRDWPGLVSRHEHIVHAAQILDLEAGVA